MDGHLDSLSSLAREYEIDRREIRTLILYHEIGTVAVMNAVVVPPDQMKRLRPILVSFAAKKKRILLSGSPCLV